VTTVALGTQNHPQKINPNGIAVYDKHPRHAPPYTEVL